MIPRFAEAISPTWFINTRGVAVIAVDVRAVALASIMTSRFLKYAQAKVTGRAWRAFPALVTLLLTASPAVATQPEGALVPTIEVSAEQFAYDCQLTNDTGPGIRTVYVRHEFNIGATASRFKLAMGPGATMTYISESHSLGMTAGNTQDGISVCYGACMPGALVVATVTYMFNGSTANCSRLSVVPHPSAETVEVIGCTGVPEIASTSDLYVLAPGAICGCPSPQVFAGTPQSFDCSPVSTESVTWGAIKALYR